MKGMRLIALITLVVGVRGEEEDFFTCLPGIMPYIGVSTPKGDTNIERGSDPFYLYCHLNPNYKLFQQGRVNSSMLSFQMGASGEGDKIFLERGEVVSEIVNITTIRHLFVPDTYGTYTVECLREKNLVNKKEAWIDPEEVTSSEESGHLRTEVVLGGGASTMKIGFCTQRIFVGYPPRDVENFSCISENWENLNCTWDEPYNPIRTYYQLKFKSGRSRFSQTEEYNNDSEEYHTDSEEYINDCCLILKKKTQNQTTSCIINFRDLSISNLSLTYNIFNKHYYHYNPKDGHMTCSDTHKCTNHTQMLKPHLDICCDNWQMALDHESRLTSITSTKTLDIMLVEYYKYENTSVDHFKPKPNGIWSKGAQGWNIVRPGPPENLKLQALPSNGLQLTFTIPRPLVHFPIGLIYSVNYKSSWDEDWTSMEPEIIKDQQEVTCNLENLQYAWTEYSVEVKLLSPTADNTSDSPYWSAVTLGEERTQAIVPPSAPWTHRGSFEIIGGISNRKVVVFWRKLEDRFHNGKEFQYTLADVTRGDHSDPLLPTTTTSTYMEFHNVGLEEYSISITSENSVGQAPNSSTIIVPAASRLQNIQPKSFTRTLYPDNIFEVAWLPPKDRELIVSYTVFWCKYKKDRPHYCEGLLDWKTFPSGPSHVDTIIHNISLPDSANYQMAVAANTQEYSSGMVWATCTIIKNRVVGKLKDVSADSIGETTALVRWRLDCSDRIGIVINYEVVYCAMKNENKPDEGCKDKEQIKKLAPDANTANLTNLTPWTAYKIMVRVVTRGGRGELSDPVVRRTNPSVPGSKPRNLRMVKTLANSAFIHWQSPSLPNGKVDGYKVNIEERLHSAWEPVEVAKNKPRYPVIVPGVVNSYTWTDLKAFTDYRVTVVACNKLELDQDTADSTHIVCGMDYPANQTFKTLVGRPGQPNELTAEQQNSSIVKLKWDRDFQLGAAEALHWEVTISRMVQARPQSVTKLINGSKLSYTLDLSKVQEEEDWSPDCENATASRISNQLNFTIRVAVANSEGAVFTSSWSHPVTVPALCQTTAAWLGAMIGGVVTSVILFFVIAYVMRSCIRCFLKKKKMFEDIGDGLDEKIVLPLTERVVQSLPQHKDKYQPAAGQGRDQHNHRRSHSKDSLLKDLVKESEEGEGRGSDTTSGCESGQSSELGDREGGSRNGEHEEAGPLLEEYITPPPLTPTWLGPADCEHYTKCVAVSAASPTPAPVSATCYSKLTAPDYVNQTAAMTNRAPILLTSAPPTLHNFSDPTVLTSTAPILPPSTTPIISTFSSLVPPSVPTPGYVTIAQLGDSKTTSPSLPAPTKGYITIADLAPSSPGKDSLTDCKEPQSAMTLPPGYSRVGTVPPTPGYVACQWVSPETPNWDPEDKTSLPSLASLTSEVGKDADSLVINPRSLPCSEMIRDSGGLTSMV